MHTHTRTRGLIKLLKKPVLTVLKAVEVNGSKGLE